MLSRKVSVVLKENAFRIHNLEEQFADGTHFRNLFSFPGHLEADVVQDLLAVQGTKVDFSWLRQLFVPRRVRDLYFNRALKALRQEEGVIKANVLTPVQSRHPANALF